MKRNLETYWQIYRETNNSIWSHLLSNGFDKMMSTVVDWTITSLIIPFTILIMLLYSSVFAPIMFLIIVFFAGLFRIFQVYIIRYNTTLSKRVVFFCFFLTFQSVSFCQDSRVAHFVNQFLFNSRVGCFVRAFFEVFLIFSGLFCQYSEHSRVGHSGISLVLPSFFPRVCVYYISSCVPYKRGIFKIQKDSQGKEVWGI